MGDALARASDHPARASGQQASWLEQLLSQLDESGMGWLIRPENRPTVCKWSLEIEAMRLHAAEFPQPTTGDSRRLQLARAMVKHGRAALDCVNRIRPNPPAAEERSLVDGLVARALEPFMQGITKGLIRRMLAEMPAQLRDMRSTTALLDEGRHCADQMEQLMADAP
ncbi:MAG: hypothetical protein ACOYKZ_06695 [Chlamydiia bacterium]